MGDQLGRDDEEELRLWTDVLYRDDCTLSYNERGKPYHHKDLTLFGCDLSRLIMVDNSPIVCRGEEPNFILIKDYFGKDNMDDELMEVYQILDALIEIDGDVRYFLCGLDADANDKDLDLTTEESCWSLTDALMRRLDAYYSEQITFSPDIGTDYQTEEDEAFMDDYEDDDIPDRERLFAAAHSPMTKQESFTTEYDETVYSDNTRITHSTHNSQSVFSPNAIGNKQHFTVNVTEATDAVPTSPSHTHTVTMSATPETLFINQSNPSISALSIDENDNQQKSKKKGVQFAKPSLNISEIGVDDVPSFGINAMRAQSAKNASPRHKSLKKIKSMHSGAASSSNYSNSDRMKRNKSLLLYPHKLDAMTKRHSRYSSMSPRYILNTKAMKSTFNKLSVADFDVNAAIHSFGAVDDGDDDEEYYENSIKRPVFFSNNAQFHKQTQSSLQIDAKRYSIKQKTTKQVPDYDHDIESKHNEIDIVPPPNFNKARQSMKTLDGIRAEKLQKKQKRESQKKNSKFNLNIPAFNPTNHQRGYSSDAIGNIDFENVYDKKLKPGTRGHKLSIVDDKQLGKVWRNSMAPRPSAKTIIAQSKHDEFVSLFQRQWNQRKQSQMEQHQRKQSHVKSLEKRKSVPDFAMLSEINSENDLKAHTLRLATLREDKLSKKYSTMESVDENGMSSMSPTSSTTTKNELDNHTKFRQKLLTESEITLDVGAKIGEWDENISTRHGCCYYFCCCCICNLFCNPQRNENDDNENQNELQAIPETPDV